MAAASAPALDGRRRCVGASLCSVVALLAFVFAASSADDDGATATSDRRSSGDGDAGPKGGRSSQPLRLGDDPSCVDDIRRFCRNPNPSSMDDLTVMQCLHDNVPEGEELKDECQQSMWIVKKRLSNDVRLSTAVGAVCQMDLQKIEECRNLDEKRSFIIPCLIDHLEIVKNFQCKEFLHRMESIVFSDYRLVYRFVESCEDDILRLKCGRLADDYAKKSIHNQGDTISCLAGNLTSLNPSCQHRILHVAELQSNDYHNDRQLFLACRDDREKFCANMNSGDGKTYQCLAAHKFDQRMSKKCRERLTVRQQLQRVNYKVNRGLTVACQVHITSERCVDSLYRSPTGGTPKVHLSVILLCLKNATRFGHQLDHECLSELVAVRRCLMEDFTLTPEIVSSCSMEIREHCRNGLERGGHTIHCLLNVERNQLWLKFARAQPLTEACKFSLGQLIKEVDARENIDVDPVLQEACSSIVQTKCSTVRPGQGKVIDCLMNLVDQPNIMTEECKDRLMETQYFVSRDFELSPSFYRTCQPFFNPLCNFEKVSILSDEEKSDLLLCLYRYQGKQGISGACSDAVKQVLIDQAKSVDLDPVIETNCFDDLGTYCSDKMDTNEEMDCLEKNFEKLEDKCKEVVKKYVEEEDEFPELSQIFMKTCEPILKDHCKEAMENGTDAEGDSLINCLIKFKASSDMPAKCRAGIEHHQLVTLKDFNLSHDFRDACKDEVREHCYPVRTKYEVVSCLSEIVQNDTLLETSSRISVECKRQLKFELFQRSENIKYDPELQEQCSSDLRDHCSNITPGKSAQIMCLRRFQVELEPQCRRIIFKRELQEAIDPTTDFALMAKCKRMIKRYCEDELLQPAAVFTCLQKHKTEDDFDKVCFNVIIQRLRIRALDVRLNPNLLKYCSFDIKRHCDIEYKNTRAKGFDAEGVVIGCLRRKFAERILNELCRDHVGDMIKESALDYVQDVALAKACRKEIQMNCSDTAMVDRNDPDRGDVELCLKGLMMKSLVTRKADYNPCWQEVIRVLAEAKPDIHVDPILYRACFVDLLHVCKGVSKGEGRQMSCLIDALNDKNVYLRTDCRKALEDRIALWNEAVQVAPPESIDEIVNHVSPSPARNLLIVIIALIGIIFVGSLFCGRVTKHMARKNSVHGQWCSGSDKNQFLDVKTNLQSLNFEFPKFLATKV